MDVVFNSEQVLSEDVHFIGLESLFETVRLTGRDDLIHVFVVVDASHVARIQNGVQVFQHLLVDDLGVCKQETCHFVLQPCLHQTFLDVFPPALHVVTLDDFNLEQRIVTDECC